MGTYKNLQLANPHEYNKQNVIDVHIQVDKIDDILNKLLIEERS